MQLPSCCTFLPEGFSFGDCGFTTSWLFFRAPGLECEPCRVKREEEEKKRQEEEEEKYRNSFYGYFSGRSRSW